MSSVDELERLTSLGEKLGYAGVELHKWVTEQMKIAEEKSKADQEREIRRLERQTQQDEIAAKARLEVEERQAKQQAEEKQKQQQFEQEKLHRKAKLQADERHEQQQWEREKLETEEALKQLLQIQQKREETESRERIRMRELELERERLSRQDREPVNDNDGNDSASSHGNAASSTRRRSRVGPKLPYIDDAKDNIDSYLLRFERYAELQGWPTQEWAIYLSALLKGNALEVYSRLAETESKSYDKLKSALLRKYDLPVDGFRKQFYDARRERDETAAEFVCRLVGYLDRWVQLAK